MISGLISGISLSFSLIAAIGAQNAFVLKQGLKREHVFVVCLICALSDALLISLGISGFHLLPDRPWIEELARDSGALFLISYAIYSFWLAAKSSDALIPSPDSSIPLGAIISTCLAFTWLNPHVYLDTVFLIGSISTHYSDVRLAFALGAIFSSFTFFFALGYGAKMLSPLFTKPESWKVLEVITGLTMCGVAVGLFL